MNTVIHYTLCPVCGSGDIREALSAKDYTVSGKTFSILHCNTCTLRFTQDVPDQASIAPYYKSENYISHTDTSKGLINRLYKRIRKITLAQKRRLVERVTGRKKGTLLDVGAGTGSFLGEMNVAGWKVTGLEPDGDARQVAKSQHGISLQESSSLFSLSQGAFDAITMWHVLEHVHDLHGYFKQLKSLLAPGGQLIVAVPNYTSSDAKAYGPYWAAYDVPRHLYHFSPLAMQTLVKRHGMKLNNTQPMWFDSFYVSLLSSKYRNGSTNWLGAAWTGFVSNVKAMLSRGRCSSQIYIISR